jgi:glutamyl-tRNA synthetase
MPVRTRFAPSPTGHLHIGGVRTALFNWLYAKHTKGSFLLRFEDTDKKRSTNESVNEILDVMTWLGLKLNKDPIFQSERLARYQEVYQNLLDNGRAYYCYCTPDELEEMRRLQTENNEKPRYNGKFREYSGPPIKGVDPVIRFKNPLKGTVAINDTLRGEVKFNNTELDDFIIARSDGTPTYNFCVVVDDMDMEITHVIRGDDHLNNTPRQINVLQALGYTTPAYTHIPMVLGQDGKPLSKRNEAASMKEYQENGFLPEAILSYLAHLGWSHGDQEIFKKSELIKHFDIEDLNKAAAAFDPKKLLWVNQEFIKSKDSQELEKLVTDYNNSHDKVNFSDGPKLPELLALQKTRCKTIQEIVEKSKAFYIDKVTYDAQLKKKYINTKALGNLESILLMFKQIDSWSEDSIEVALNELTESLSLKIADIAQPIRVALTGSTVSPPIAATLVLMGREKSLGRLQDAINSINK